MLEVAVPAWHIGLSSKQCMQIERVQRVAVSLILGKTKLEVPGCTQTTWPRKSQCEKRKDL